MTLGFKGNAEQVIAPKRETAIFLKTSLVKFYVVAGGFALGELRRWAAVVSNIMGNKILNRFTLFVAVLIISSVSALAQSSTLFEEPDEYGFPSIICGAGRATYEYQSRSGEKIIVFARKYESIMLADEALERSLKSAVKVLERENPVDGQGNPLGLRVIVQYPEMVVILERKGLWLYSTEAASLESLMKFDAYEKGNQRIRSSMPPNKSMDASGNSDVLKINLV